jgi:hypothetical protein
MISTTNMILKLLIKVSSKFKHLRKRKITNYNKRIHQNMKKNLINIYPQTLDWINTNPKIIN